MAAITKHGIVRIDTDHPEHSVIQQAVQILDAGGLVVAPTETKYGLLANADDSVALQHVFEIKGRRADVPTALFVTGTDMMLEFGEMTGSAIALAKAFLPGPMTIVVKARKNWGAPRVVEGKVGFRLSSCETIREIMRRVPYPITATSANRSGEPELETVMEIRQMLGAGVELYLDAGPLKGVVSTVVDCTGPRPVILRPGAVTGEDISRVTG
jgi:L-threonylcarbamoyladenylate synthase